MGRSADNAQLTSSAMNVAIGRSSPIPCELAYAVRAMATRTSLSTPLVLANVPDISNNVSKEPREQHYLPH